MKISIVIATHNRTKLLRECLDTITSQSFRNYDVIIAHSGIDDGTKELIAKYPDNFIYLACRNKGAAIQRNEGVQFASSKWVVFFDDDVLLEDEFLNEISNSIIRNPLVKGVSGIITNQFFIPPSKIFQSILRLFDKRASFKLDGQVVGPALNFLPKKEGAIEEVIQWMPGGVCAYERKIFIDLGGFPKQFVGYSYGEDLYFSLLVSQDYDLILNRNAKLYHKDIGSTSHENHYKIAQMQVDNRNYINQVILKQNRFLFNMQLLIWNFTTLFAQVLRGNLKLSKFVKAGIGYFVAFLRNSIYARQIK